MNENRCLVCGSIDYLKSVSILNGSEDGPCKVIICEPCILSIRDKISKGETTMLKRIDNKHSVTESGVIIKTSNGAPIPDHEPKILFRGRDRLAVPMMEYYLKLCINDGCTTYQLESMRAMIDEFKQFQIKFPSTMKQPGSTSGR